MLTTYTPQFDYSAIDRANLQPSTRVKYKAAIARLIDAQVDPFDHQALATYAASLPVSSRAFLKSSLSLMASEYKRTIKANATVNNLSQLQVALYRLDAMEDAIQVQQIKGTKAHIWLSQMQVDEITSLPNLYTVDGLRDYIILAGLLGAGLRRKELEMITFDSLKRLPSKDGYRDVLEVRGKGDVMRVVPISPLLSKRLREWQQIIGGGRIARSINKAGKIGESLSDIGIFRIVRKYGNLISIPILDPHDCRRSFGRLGYEATKDIVLIRDLLGHADVKTTQKYIGLHINTETTASDYIIRPEEFFQQVSGD